jgi:hypothetical protein
MSTKPQWLGKHEVLRIHSHNPQCSSGAICADSSFKLISDWVDLVVALTHHQSCVYGFEFHNTSFIKDTGFISQSSWKTLDVSLKNRTADSLVVSKHCGQG